MYKKIFSFTILLSALIFSTASAQCPTYLDADKNYILYADLGGQGAGLYLDRHTVGIAKKTPTEYTILVDTVEVPDAAEGKTQIVNRYAHRYRFDTKLKKAYRYELYSNEWIELDPTITNVEDDDFTYDVTIAEMAFYLSTKSKFFKDSFDKDFYKILRHA